jgi:hypothetical protein
MQRFLKRFRENRQGLAWILIAGLLLSLPFCALVYWVLDYPFELLLDTCEGLVTFTGTMASAWITTKVLISYLLAFCLIYSVLWVIINAKHSNVWGY